MQTLPFDVLKKTAVELPFSDLVKLCATSKAHRKICEDDYFWRDKFFYDFPDRYHSYVPPGMWKTYYYREVAENMVDYEYDEEIYEIQDQLSLLEEEREELQRRSRELGNQIAELNNRIRDRENLLYRQANKIIESAGKDKLVQLAPRYHFIYVENTPAYIALRRDPYNKAAINRLIGSLASEAPLGLGFQIGDLIEVMGSSETLIFIYITEDGPVAEVNRLPKKFIDDQLALGRTVEDVQKAYGMGLEPTRYGYPSRP